MRTGTIALTAGMLLILASALIIRCSSAPVPNFSEEEAIAIGRSYHRDAEKARFEQAQKPTLTSHITLASLPRPQPLTQVET